MCCRFVSIISSIFLNTVLKITFFLLSFLVTVTSRLLISISAHLYLYTALVKYLFAAFVHQIILTNEPRSS